MEKKLRRRQGVEEKTKSWREDKEMKEKQEDQEKRSQEDKSDRPRLRIYPSNFSTQA
jgi:hypothetical protein